MTRHHTRTWLALAAPLMLTAPTALWAQSGQGTSIELPEPIPDGQVEILAGAKRTRVPSSTSTPATDRVREDGVLPIRGATVGVPDPSFEIRRTTVSGPMRDRLRDQLDALIEIYREVFALTIDASLASELGILNPTEDRGTGSAPLLRRRYDHDFEAPPQKLRRARERALVARALHSTSHLIVERYWPSAPFWLDEGLAVLFEGISIDRDGLSVGLTDEHLERHREIRHLALRGTALERQQLRSLEPGELIALERSTWEALPPDAARRVQTELAALLLYFLGDPGFIDVIALGLGDTEPLERVEVTREESEAYAKSWRRARDAEIRRTLLDTRPPPPEEPPPARRIRRDFRCVPALVGVGQGSFVPVLFCTRGNRLLERGGSILLE